MGTRWLTKRPGYRTIVFFMACVFSGCFAVLDASNLYAQSAVQLVVFGEKKAIDLLPALEWIYNI